MAAPQLAFAGTSAAHSTDFKALEILETSQPPAAPPAPKRVPPKPKAAPPAPKPAPQQPSDDARALDALIDSTPPSATRTVPAAIKASAPKPAPRALAAPKPKPQPQPKAQPPDLDDQVFSPIPLKATDVTPEENTDSEPAPAASTAEIEDADPTPAPTVAAITPVQPSAESRALDALIEFPGTPQPTRPAAVARPVQPAPRARARAVAPATSQPPSTTRRLRNDADPYRVNLDPDEIQKIQPRKIQSVWY
jgi:hypothetical protein